MLLCVARLSPDRYNFLELSEEGRCRPLDVWILPIIARVTKWAAIGEIGLDLSQTYAPFCTELNSTRMARVAPEITHKDGGSWVEINIEPKIEHKTAKRTVVKATSGCKTLDVNRLYAVRFHKDCLPLSLWVPKLNRDMGMYVSTRAKNPLGCGYFRHQEMIRLDMSRNSTQYFALLHKDGALSRQWDKWRVGWNIASSRIEELMQGRSCSTHFF